jgi:hypothetical protein
MLQLPLRNNGLDLCPSADKSPAAYLSSFVASAADPQLARFKSSLLPSLTDAVSRFASLAGLDVAAPSPVSALLPACCDKLLSTPYTSRLQSTFHSRRGIMGVLTNFLQQVRLQALRQSVLPPADADLSALPRLQKSEIVHVLATTARGRLTSIIMADLALHYNRVHPDSFRAAMCYNFGLPVHPYGSNGVPGFDYPVLKCTKDDAFFDACGDHAAACSYCHSSRSATHGGLRGAFVRFAKIAGFTVTSEPSTFSILQSLFSTPEQLRSLFPKYHDADAGRRRAALEEALDSIRAAPDNATRRAIVAGVAALERNRPAPSAAEGVAVRADALAVPDDGKGKALLIDVTGVHDSTKDSINKQLAFHVQLQRRSQASFAASFSLASSAGDSPAVAKAVAGKHKRYGLIETLANIQAAGFGPQLPLKFVAGVVTHRGEMASELIDAIEYCTGRFKAGLRTCPDIDGHTPPRAAAAFRTRFKHALCVQIAGGFGRQLLATSAMGLSAAVSS